MDERVRLNILDSIFYCKSINNPKSYIGFHSFDTIKSLDKKDKKNYPYVYYRQNDSILRNYCRSETAKAFNQQLKLGVNFVKPGSNDSLFFTKELSKLKGMLMDSLVVNYTPSEVFQKLFQKYPSDVAIILDVLMYNSKYHALKVGNTFAVYRLFVFDLKGNKLLFYDYTTSGDHEDYSCFLIANYTSISKSFNKLLRSVRKYLNVNEIFREKN
jgi:hypothetical protein